MSELLKALQEVERLKLKLSKSEEEKDKLLKDNYLLRENLREEYPFFMFVKVDKQGWKDVTYRHRNNYFNETPSSFSDLKEQMFNDVHRLLNDIEKELES